MPDTLADELAIRDLISRYADAVNRYDGSDWSATWAEDARWYFLDAVHEGRATILELWSSVMQENVMRPLIPRTYLTTP